MFSCEMTRHLKAQRLIAHSIQRLPICQQDTALVYQDACSTAQVIVFWWRQYRYGTIVVRKDTLGHRSRPMDPLHDVLPIVYRLSYLYKPGRYRWEGFAGIVQDAILPH